MWIVEPEKRQLLVYRTPDDATPPLHSSGELDTAVPYRADGQRVTDVRCWITVNQQQVGKQSGGNMPAVGESEAARGGGGGGLKRIDGRKPCRH